MAAPHAEPPTPAPRIRPATVGDGAALAAIYRPAVADAATSFELEPPDAAEMAARVGRLTARTPWLACDAGGEVLGYAYAGPHRDRAAYQWSVDVAVYVRGDARGRGVGRALYTSLFALLEAQGFRNAYAGITLPNAGSEGLHAAFGFAPVGVYRRVGHKRGAWHDVLWLGRAVGAHDDDDEPAPPVPLPGLTAAVVEAALAAGAPLLRPRRADAPDAAGRAPDVSRA